MIYKNGDITCIVSHQSSGHYNNVRFHYDIDRGEIPLLEGRTRDVGFFFNFENEIVIQEEKTSNTISYKKHPKYGMVISIDMHWNDLKLLNAVVEYMVKTFGLKLVDMILSYPRKIVLEGVEVDLTVDSDAMYTIRFFFHTDYMAFILDSISDIEDYYLRQNGTTVSASLHFAPSSTSYKNFKWYISLLTAMGSVVRNISSSAEVSFGDLIPKEYIQHFPFSTGSTGGRMILEQLGFERGKKPNPNK